KRDGETKARASFESHAARQTEDFLLSVGRSPRAVGFSVLSHKEAEKDGTFMMVVAPQSRVAEHERASRDVIFVVDTSGSMEGDKIKQAREALRYGVATLGPDDRFNLIGFASATRRFRDGLVPVTDASRKSAADWIERLQAKGGTDIHSALTEAVALAQAERSTMVVFLTDGLPSVGVQNAPDIRKGIAAANTSKARIFTFGVGHDLDVALLDTIAEETGGTRDYVAPGENIEIVTSRFFRKVSRPVLTDVKLELGSGVRDVYPRHIGDLFAGTQVVVFGRYREAGARTIALSGRLAGKTVRHEHQALFRASPGPDYLERLWAHRKVAFLLDSIRLHGTNKEVVDEVIALGTQHAIVTPYTSGLVVEESVETDNDLPFGEGGRFGNAPFEGPSNDGTIGLGGGAGGAFRRRGGGRDLGTGGGGRKKFDDAADDALRWLAAHQSPSGGWSARDFDRFCDGKRATPWDQEVHRGQAARDVHVTAQATLAFLGAGYTNRGRHPFAKVVSRALRYLKSVQDPEGCFGPRRDPSFLLGHAQAAQAMVEAYAMTGSPIWKGAAQRALDFLALARQPYGVWGRGLKSKDADLRVTAWAVTAYLAADLMNQDQRQRGKPEALTVDVAFLEDVRDWVKQVADSNDGGVRDEALPSATTTHAAAAGMIGWLRVLLGADPRKDPAVQLCAKRVAPAFVDRHPTGEEAYFGTYLLFQVGGRAWDGWKRALDSSFGHAARQEQEGDYCVKKGSWTPIGAPSRANGRVGATAQHAMELMAFYRYDRLIRFADRPAGPTTAPARPLTAAEASKALKRRKEAASNTDLETHARTRRVAGKTFAQERSGRWVDAAWDRAVTPKPIPSLSEAWFALTRSNAEARKYLALGDRLVVVIDGQPYEVTPAK
ncbi:MAG: VWA domain-containing protein, partial [Planctomycetota bacterium]|nr:VWA domain-containing protein [Planctomycetota bacterium]